ncbi:MAG TPA: hypothetical protein VHD36_18900 [Pirellulales bacterium]|nr:hypothetical protein [Pirellulales bacterium]
MSFLTRWWYVLTRNRFARPMWERAVIVSFDDHQISATYPPSARSPHGQTQAIAWADVTCLAIETNSSGPSGADFWYLLEGEGGKLCAFPLGAAGGGEAVAEFSKRFPEFDGEAFRNAIGSTTEARFVCWKRGGGE